MQVVPELNVRARGRDEAHDLGVLRPVSAHGRQRGPDVGTVIIAQVPEDVNVVRRLEPHVEAHPLKSAAQEPHQHAAGVAVPPLAVDHLRTAQRCRRVDERRATLVAVRLICKIKMLVLPTSQT